MKTVHLARGLSFPAAELATKVTGAFGIRGSGKSSLMSLADEQLLDAGIQVIILDPVGVHFAIRLAANGKSPSPYQIPVLGGRHGDLTLAPTAGEVVGAALARSSDSCVLDISAMKKGERVRFSAAFFEAFYEGKKENPAPVLLCLEEAQRFAPQIMFKGSGQEQMLGAVEELAEQGRNFGVGLWLNSLRPQKINKDVTSLMDLVFGFRLTGVHERKAVKDWLQEKGATGREEIDGELPSLQAGHAFVWSPAVFNIFGKYHMNRKTTYDAGATPLYARAKVKMKRLDLDKLESEMTAVVTEAKANDPRALKARVAELERELAKKRDVQTIVQPVAKTVEKSVLKEADMRRLEKAGDALYDAEQAFIQALAAERDSLSEEIERLGNGVAAKLEQRQKAVTTEIANLRAMISPARNQAPMKMFEKNYGPGPTWTNDVPPKLVPPLAARHVRDTASGRRTSDSAPGSVSKCARALLNVLAVRRHASDSQISALSGYRKTSSSFANGLSELRVAGYITGDPSRREITQPGLELIGPVEALPTGPALLDYWRSRLGTCENTLLKHVYDKGTISRQELSERSNYSITSSSFANAISGLRVLDLIHGPPGGDLTIADVFRE